MTNKKKVWQGQALFRLAVVSLVLPLTAVTAKAQQTTGVPGSPSATTTIDGKYIPNPAPPFTGKINLSAVDSKPAWPPTIVPPKGAPNVLLIMTDDQGYGITSTFGGVIPTPAMDRPAKAGLRYTQFHSTALCSPTRAALITGRNHHSVGFGVISEQATGYPGYDSIIEKNSATVGEILRENGYSTSWFGKNHNTPSYLYSLAGLLGEDVWEPEPSKAELIKLDPADVLTTEESAKLLAPLIKPLPSFDEVVLGMSPALKKRASTAYS
jgi:hypothetical protein